MLVYRIETEDGTGPYAGACPDWGDEEPQNRVKHPMPFDDSMLRDAWSEIYNSPYTRDWFFGFTGVEQMRAWFYDDHWIKAMAKAGLDLAVYECPEGAVAVGHTQVVFNRELCECVDRHLLTKYVSSESPAAPVA